MSHPTILMCRPTFYGVNYEINPWMHIRRQPNRPLALRQWESLRRALQEEVGATVHLCRARPHVPDMTFTANAGLVDGRLFIPSRFRYAQRAGEEPHFINWFRTHGFRIVPLPDPLRFEGAGDALFVGRTLIAGYYFRSDFQTHEAVGRALNVRVCSVALVNEYFYHLDTCFAPLGSDSAIYYPPAFDLYGRRLLKETVGDLLSVSDQEAYQFACNAVIIGKKAIIPKPCVRLSRDLRRRGYAILPLDLSEFMKAGGSAKCLTLRLE
jgi:N-dimethylarginine dimethylaminohydrolase